MNQLLTSSKITLEALRVLKNNLTFTRLVTRKYDSQYGIDGAKIGDTLNIRKPPRYVGRRGAALAVEDVTQTSVPLVLNTQYGCDVNFTSKDLLLSVERFGEDILGPAVATVANSVDFDGMGQFVNVADFVGSIGVVPNALMTYLLAGVNLDNNACPMDGQRSMVINPLMQATIVDALKALFQDASSIAKQYIRGMMGIAGGWKWFMDQNVNTFLTGVYGGTPAIAGANQTGSQLLTSGWTASINNVLRRGDIIQVATTNKVNPQNRQSVGTLMPFRVTANVNSDGAGLATVPIARPLIPGQVQFATVDASPINGSLISIFGAAAAGQAAISAANSPMGLGFHKDAFAFASADLPLPRGVDMATRKADEVLGMSMRLVRAYDINNDKFPCRLDLLGGWATIREELATRVVGG